jgi:hypothetical protein
MRTELGSEFANPLYLPGPKANYDYLYHSSRSGAGPQQTSGPITLPVSDRTGSDSVIDMISHALSYRICHSSRLSTRVLDVSDFFLDGRVQLKRSTDLDLEKPNQYIALSHCWGRIDMPKLQKHNITDYMEGTEVSQLPRTFREAIDVTFRLGITYFWIDSLCIIQDDAADWDYEASLMAYIYRNAFCTIAAVASVDGNGGLFRPQWPKKSIGNSGKRPSIRCTLRTVRR